MLPTLPTPPSPLTPPMLPSVPPPVPLTPPMPFTPLPQRSQSPSPTPRPASSPPAVRTTSAERPLTITVEQWSAVTPWQPSTRPLLQLKTINPQETTRALLVLGSGVRRHGDVCDANQLHENHRVENANVLFCEDRVDMRFAHHFCAPLSKRCRPSVL